MTAPLMHEPTDPPEPTVTIVSASMLDRIACTLGAVVENDQGRTVVTWNGRCYVAVTA